MLQRKSSRKVYSRDRRKKLSISEYVHPGKAHQAEHALRRLCISPQCGFASHEEGNNVTEEDMAKKLGLVVQIAKDIWPDQA